MGQWIENEDYDDLPGVEVGDIVHFMLDDTFLYRIKAYVNAIEDFTVVATVDSIFDWGTGNIVTGGDITGLEGNELELSYGYIHNVISR